MAANIMAGLYILLTLSFMLLVWVSIVEIIRAWIAGVKKWIHRRAVDRRVISQAKSAGVWGNPMRLGGRALEIKVKQMLGMKRKPGETDAELRLRYENEILVLCFRVTRIPVPVLRDAYHKVNGYPIKVMLADEIHGEERRQDNVDRDK